MTYLLSLDYGSSFDDRRVATQAELVAEVVRLTDEGRFVYLTAKTVKEPEGGTDG